MFERWNQQTQKIQETFWILSFIEIRNMWTVFFSVFIFMLLWWDCDNILCISFYWSLSFKRWLQKHRAAAVSFVLMLNQLLLTFLHLSLLSMLFLQPHGFPFARRFLFPSFIGSSVSMSFSSHPSSDVNGVRQRWRVLPHHSPRLHLILSSHIFHLGNWGISNQSYSLN